MDDDDYGLRELSVIARRHLRESAAMADPSPDELLYQHTVLCQSCLPYRDPGPGVREWQREQGRASLLIEAGKVRDPIAGKWVDVGLPFGPKPRLILAHLNAEALRTGSPEIEVKDSLTAFVKHLRLDPKGRNMRAVKDQLARLAAAQIRLAVAYGAERARQVQAHLVGGFDLWFPKDEGRRVLWPATVRLSPDYFDSLQRHAVPLHPQALRALSHNTMGLDLYAWLAQRLYRIKPGHQQLVPWKPLKGQFGWQYGRMDNFKRVFRLTLRDVLIHYSAARVEEDGRGLILYHSAPPILAKYHPIVQGGRAEAPPLSKPAGKPGDA